MAGTDLRITIDNRQVRELFERAPVVINTRLRQLIEIAAIDVQRAMLIAAPVGVTGNLRRSVTYKLSGLTAEITPAANYAPFVENGTRPHWVSVGAGTSLRAWAIHHGVNPFAVQKSIARKGTKPHPFVKPTYEQMKPKVEADIAAGMSVLIEELR